MNIQILDALQDRQAWHQALESLPLNMQDVYFEPEYVALHCFEPKTKPLMFVYKHEDKIWLYPFLLKPILKVGAYEITQKLFDIETAYGYGGPLANAEDSTFLKGAHQAFTEWCKNQNVVAEFVRLHPLLKTEQFLDSRVELVYSREVVSLNLTSLNDGKLPFEAKTCNMLKRAERLRIQVKTCLADDYFDRFVGLYLKNMKAFKADKYYYFSNAYFHSLRQLVKSSGLLLAAVREKEWLAAAIFLKGKKWLHYHLSASNPDKRLPGSNNVLLYAGAKIGLSQELKVLHLGGGSPHAQPGEEDSLFKFKQSMATDIHRFYIGKRIHNMEAYLKLRKLWEEQCSSLVPIYSDRLLCYRYGE